MRCNIFHISAIAKHCKVYVASNSFLSPRKSNNIITNIFTNNLAICYMALLRMLDSIDNDPGGDGEDGDADAAEVQFLAPPLQWSRVRGAMLVLLCYREEEGRSIKIELNKTNL